MPTYEYRCKACDHTLEQFQSIKARPLKKCPACGKPKLERLIGSGAGIIFRGSGFYETDYRSESYKAQASKEKQPPTPKTEPKPKKNDGDGKKMKAAG
jgi:putative FmdB family regulatory protein